MLNELELKAISDKLSVIAAHACEGAEKNAEEIAEIKAEVLELQTKLAQATVETKTAPRQNIYTKFGESFATVADQVRQALASKSNAPFRWAPGISVKQFLGVDGGSSPDTSFPAVIDRRPDIIVPPIPPTIFDALPVIQITSNIYEYVRYEVTESHNNAAIVAEGELKPTSTADFEDVQASPLVFAHLMTLSNKLASDNPNVVGQFVPAKMRQQLLQVMDGEIINGPGGSGRINGLLTQAVAITGASGAANDRIAYAIAVMRGQGYNPSYVIINNLDAEAIRQERATSVNIYVGGVKFGGLPTVESVNVAAGTAIVVDSSPNVAAVLEREAPSFMLGLTSDNFSRNLFTARSEARLTAVVFDLGGVRKVALS